MAPRAAIFDLDGTLIDSAGVLAAIGRTVLAEAGLPGLAVDEARGYIGGGAARFLARAFDARGRPLSDAALREKVARFQELYVATPGADNPPYPGADAALRTLRAEGLALGLCTNKPMRPTRHVLEALGWSALFDSVVAGDTLPVKKPDPAPLRFCAEALACPLEKLVYVGDSETDAETAEAAGARFLLHAEGYRQGPIEAIRHDQAFSSLADLPALILRPGSESAA